MNLNYKVKNNNQSINQILQSELKISSRLLYKLIKKQKILLNNVPCNTNTIPNKDDIISIDFNYPEDNSNIIESKMDLDIKYEDEWLLIVNKPAGIAIHPSILHYNDSLCNGIKYYFNTINLNKKIRPVNRLDRDTSGLVIFAKCEYIQECLIKQMQEKSFKKTYLCVCDGIFEKKEDTINLPIARKPNSIIERYVHPSGQNSITHYKVLKEKDNKSVVQCILETGRTHQIRVHMSYINNPLIGDDLYGNKSDLIDRQALHCYKLEFTHPITNKKIKIESDLPEDIKNII